MSSPRPSRLGTLLALLALAVTAGLAQQPPAQGQPPGQGQASGRGAAQRPARDRAQQQPQGTASISGRVLTADTGRPVKRARVVISAGGRGSRAAATDGQGRFQIGELPAGSYTVAASKTGFVDAIYGQRRPLQPGTPVQLAESQELANIDLRLVRGGVITGRVLDEDGEALARALVTVQRYQYVRGERQLIPAGGDQSDDRGQYRVFGLPPGEYYVSAQANGLTQLIGRGLQQLGAALGAAGFGGRGGRGGGGLLAPFAVDDPAPTGYAATYYPGVVTAADAGKLSVGPGQELAGIDFQVQLVTLATVRGIVAGADNTVGVILVPQAGGGVLGGQALRGSSQADGSFSIPNVPPGHYIAVARSGGRWDEQKVGMQPVNVTGENVSGVTLVMQPGATLSGNVTVESSGTAAPADYSVFRVDAPEVDPLPLGAGPGRGGGPNATGGGAEKNGTFEVSNLLPGKHYIRVTGQGAWSLKSVSVNGRDVTDQPIELRSGQNVENVMVVLTDRTTEITGTVRDASGKAIPAITVIAFSTDQQYWRPQSRQIQAVRTNQTGAYRIRGLPPGDYELMAVDDVDQGEWFDPSFLEQIRPAAKRISVSEGETRTQDLTGGS